MTQFENTYLNDAGLRSLYAPIFKRRVESRQNCPSGDTILALIRRQGDERERLLTLDHVMSCGPCKSDFKVLQTVEEAGQKLVRDEKPIVTPVSVPITRSVNSANLVTPPAARRWSYPILAFAASAVIAIGIGSNFASSNKEARVERGVTEAVGLVAPAESTMVSSAASLTFYWNSVPRAIEYHFELLDSAGRVIVSSVTSDTSITFPNLGDQIDSELSYRWWVRSVTPGGEFERSEMRLIRFNHELE